MKIKKFEGNCKSFCYSNEQGFTLIEAMVALTIFAIVGLAAFSLLKQGMSARKAINRATEQLQQRAYLISLLEKDINGATNSILENFQGYPDSVRFLTRRSFPGQEPILFRVAYFVRFSPEWEELELFRSQADFWGNSEEKLIISRIKIWQVAYLQKQKEDLRWLDQWLNRGDLPKAIRIRYSDFSDPEVKSIILPLRNHRQVFQQPKTQSENAER